MKPKELSKLTVPELQERHRDIYKDFAPTLTRYQEMATDVLLIQIELMHKRLRESFPKLPIVEQVEIAGLSARAPLEQFEAALAEIRQRKIEPAAVVYNPLTFTFKIFGKGEQ